MDVDMQTLKDATGRPDGKLFPASAANPREVKAWVAERRKRTNGRKFLVGCTSHWKGYVLRSFLSLFEELKGEHGWEDLDTSKNPMKVIYDMDRKRAPSVMLFCLNSFYYPMALLQEYRAYFHELRSLGTIIAVWNDDLHYYDQFNPITLRDEVLTKVDVLVGTYTYFMDDYFAKITDSVNERDLPLTVWLPHSSGPDFVNTSFNEYPINKIILSGKLGSNWYPLRHWLGIYQQDHRGVMDLYQHSGYYVADNQSAIYASYLRSYRTAITTTLIFQYVIAKIFEIPSTGALLAVNRDVAPLLAALGMNEGEHYVGFDRRDPEQIVWDGARAGAASGDQPREGAGPVHDGGRGRVPEPAGAAPNQPVSVPGAARRAGVPGAVRPRVVLQVRPLVLRRALAAAALGLTNSA
ncbi:hypothetical protein ON010_g18657 [Phytophthora cinnamomi]|nr:hypothetical protein ON010_g18657 [Phytophthora cinnamomi]